MCWPREDGSRAMVQRDIHDGLQPNEIVHLLHPVYKARVVIPEEMKQNYEIAYFRCINWTVKSYDDHMKLLEYAIGFIHSKLKSIEDKHEELKKVHYKQKQIKAR